MKVTSSSEVSFPGEYITEFCSMERHGLVTAVSSGSMYLMPLDPTTVDPSHSYSSINTGTPISDLKAVDENVLASSGSEGVKFWDLRAHSATPVNQISSPLPGAGVLCLDINGSQLVMGTELVKSDAAVFLYDMRTSKPVVSYLDSHNDDITVVDFHPTDPHCLLSGSVDGLINIYNTTIQDEDDAVYQGINHGASIHRAGFLSNTRIFGLSHMETLSTYQLADPDENVIEPKPNEFGDLRERFGCEYVVDWYKSAKFSPSYLACGSSNNLQQFKLIPFFDEKPGDISTYIYLEGAHGEEVVRSVHITPSYVCTGGEDGIIRYWTPELNTTLKEVDADKEMVDESGLKLGKSERSEDSEPIISKENARDVRKKDKKSSKHKHGHSHKPKHHKKPKDTHKPY